MPQGYGFKVGGDADLGPQLHDPQPDRERRTARSRSPGRSTGCPRRRPARTDIHPTIRTVARRRRRAARLPGLRRRAGLRHQRRRQVHVPRRGPDRPARAGLRGAREDQQRRASGRCPPAGATLVFGRRPPASRAARRGHAGRSRRPRRGHDRRRRPVRGQAAVQIRRPLLRAGGRGELGRRDDRDPPATGGSASRPATRSRSTSTYDVRKASWYESMGILPARRSAGHDDPAAKDPFDDAAAVKAMYDEGGILTHGRLPENIDTKARKDLKLPDPRKLKQQGQRVPKRRASRSTASATRPAASRPSGASRPAMMRPPVVKPGRA